MVELSCGFEPAAHCRRWEMRNHWLLTLSRTLVREVAICSESTWWCVCVCVCVCVWVGVWEWGRREGRQGEDRGEYNTEGWKRDCETENERVT